MGTIQPAWFGPKEGIRAHVQGMEIDLGSNASGSWQTIATGGPQPSHLYIEAISGHNSSGYTYSGSASTYTYNVSNGSVRTLWTGSGTGGCSCRMVVYGSPEQWVLQLAPTSNYGTNAYVTIAAALQDMNTGSI